MQKDVTISWSNFRNESRNDITTAPVALSDSTFACERGVLVKALNGNTGTIYVGYSEATATADTGYELGSGESVFIEVNRISKIYVSGVSTSDRLAQGVCWIAV